MTREQPLGVWVSMQDDSSEPLRVTPVQHDADADAIAIDGQIFEPHLVLAGLWRATSGQRFAHAGTRVLWLRAAGGPWRPFCRPGLDELLPAPPPPDTRIALDAVAALLRDNRRVVAFELNDGERQGQPCARLTVWHGVLGEWHAWSRDGMIDLCELG